MNNKITGTGGSSKPTQASGTSTSTNTGTSPGPQASGGNTQKSSSISLYDRRIQQNQGAIATAVAIAKGGISQAQLEDMVGNAREVALNGQPCTKFVCREGVRPEDTQLYRQMIYVLVIIIMKMEIVIPFTLDCE